MYVHARAYARVRASALQEYTRVCVHACVNVCTCKRVFIKMEVQYTMQGFPKLHF